jgi:hypothetical protein
MTAGWFQPRRADVSSMLPVRLSCAVERASAGSLGNSERRTKAVARFVTKALRDGAALMGTDATLSPGRVRRMVTGETV